MKSEHQLRVEEFMRKADGLAPGKQGIPLKPMIPSEAVRLLRARLIMEEALETVVALGFKLHFDRDYETDAPNCEFTPEYEPDLIQIADGCADLSVVTIGTLSACGIPDKPILEAVDANNLAKFGPGSSVDEHGKLVKPPGHEPPDLRRILEELLK